MATHVMVKRTAAVVGGVTLLLIVCIALLPASFWRGVIERGVAHATGRQARIGGHVEVHVFSWNPRVMVDDFTLANSEWSHSGKPLLAIKRIDVTVRLTSLLFGELTFPRIAIEGPRIDLERDRAERVNWDFSPAASVNARKSGAALHLPVIQQLRVADGLLSVSDRVRHLNFEGRISADESRQAPERSALDVHGTGVLNAKPFDLRITGAPLLNVDHSRPYTLDAAMTAADIKLDAKVTIPHPFDLASVRAGVHLSAQNLADMYYLTGLALPNTPPYAISGTLQRQNLTFTIDDLRGTIGTSDIEGKLSVETDRERPKLNATLASKVLNLDDLAVPLGTGPSALPAEKSGGKSAAKPAGALSAPVPRSAEFLLPDADLQVNRVRGMDADVTFDAASLTASKLPLRQVHFHLALQDGKLDLSPLSFALPQGQLSGSVSINARGADTQTDIDMRLKNVDLSQFKPKSADVPPLSGQLLGRVKLHGTGNSVHKAAASADGDITMVIPNGQMRAVFAELTGINLARGIGLFLAKSDATTEVRCGVANFHAGNGDLNATALIIDTTHVLITGHGHVDLKSEDLDLSFRGQPKETRLLRLRSPITVRGSLLHPRVGVNAAKAIGQTSGAVALGVLLTPLAALLAFVDGGLAKDANCAALLSPVEQAHGLHQKTN